ncbi:hypothetical protein [Sphingomonas sp. 3-13AW]|uniref:hypothetical protein n=1 Tax=Sphingomonas sp. 3-13AW TaxID=3050450 RepID=UPI003BB5386F
MSTLALKQDAARNGPEAFHIVIRGHDLSGTDYQPLLRVERCLAVALGRSGVVIRGKDTSIARGRPGIVIDTGPIGEGYIAQVRADVSDPTTVMATFLAEEGLVSELLGDQISVPLDWVGAPPSI